MGPRTALERFGAVSGEGHGLHGRPYAIDTMSGSAVIEEEVAGFLEFAAEHPELRFVLTPIGTGIAGYGPEEIASLFGRRCAPPAAPRRPVRASR